MKTIDRKDFGQTSAGETVQIYTLRSDSGIEADIINYGGAVVSLRVPDRDGRMRDIVLGYDSVADYENQRNYFGVLVGRYANRIAKGRFTLDGRQYQLARNDGENHLHGGLNGFDKKLWTAEDRDGKLNLTYISPDGEENYPGRLELTVSYSLESSVFKIEYSAVSDKITLCNPTNHSYFNLNGHGSGTVLNQKVRINADSFTPTDAASIPSGSVQNVENTPMDLRNLTRIGENVASPYSQLKNAGGFDHNYVLVVQKEPPIIRDFLSQNNLSLQEAAYAVSDESGISLSVFTDMPGLQFYSGNSINGSLPGKGGAVYTKHSGFCFETQVYPDSINHPSFPQAILKPGETFRSVTVYKFGR